MSGGYRRANEINLLDDGDEDPFSNAHAINGNGNSSNGYSDIHQQNLSGAYNTNLLDDDDDTFVVSSSNNNNRSSKNARNVNGSSNGGVLRSDNPFDDMYNDDNDDDSIIFADTPDLDHHNDIYGNINRNAGGDSSTGVRGFYNRVRAGLGIPSNYSEVDARREPRIHNYDYDYSNDNLNDLNDYEMQDQSGFDDDLNNNNNNQDIGHDHRPPPDADLSEDFKNKFDIRRILNKALRRKVDDDDGSGAPRMIHLNDHHANSSHGYYGNHISTTKYNLFTFIPKFLFEQFSKYANLFFLFTSIIQQVPHVSPTNRYTTIGTLSIVLLVSAIKEITEDLKRASSDAELNRSSIDILDPKMGTFITKKWIDVKVGDIIKVKNGSVFPADIIILSSSEPEGLCYIETANLDGETNLKIKQSKEETSHLLSPRDLSRIQGQILSERPNSSLYTYEGTLTLNGQEISLSPDQMLLRGASLKNTQWIHGIVIFTGHETKLMRNATATPIKRTDVERIINLQIIALFLILITLAIVSSAGDIINITYNKKNLGYLPIDDYNRLTLFFQDILTYWILYSNLVPISLFVSVELIKYYQAWLISSDLDLYDEATDTPTVVRTSSLVEELGQIKYIFSDKTGTLTRNIMEFKTCSIGGRCYIETIPEDKQAALVDGVEMGYYTFKDLQDDRASGKNADAINEFLTLLAACHTVIPETDDYGRITYQAASPDEGALVEGAAMLGFKFTVRKPSSITMVVDENREQTFELLNVCEFNSTRKRMSAIFRCPDGKIRLYIKGADTVILERLDQQYDNPYTEATVKHLEDFAVEGLRTLCLASRVIPEEEYQSWSQKYNQASTSLDNRSQKLDEVAELIEKDLFLLGATAIEDKLQDGVPDTIHDLQEAGIKVWVLTGDRQETAINIGMSCRLLSEDMNLLIVNEETKEDTRANLQSKLIALQSEQISADDLNSLALIIDGKSLGYALEPDLEDLFLNIGVACKAVICCRVSPLQKALVVKLVKRKEKALLLAIGDGANDVSMIQAAHVGVGISGMEGMQAARSADFAIGQFKYLKKLLLVHGSWSYQRISLSILYSFYKNIALYMTQFWFVFSNGFSGQSICESWTLTFYNVFYTVLPPFILGIFDQYINSNMLMQYPKTYNLGQQGHFFNVQIFWSWAINGFFHSAVIYICGINIYKYGNELSSGLISNNWTFGVAIYTACTFTVLGKAALVSSQWTKFTLVAIPGSVAVWLVLFPLYATIAPKVGVSIEYQGIVPHVYGSLVYWTMAIVLPIICLARDLLYKFYKRTWSPEYYHDIQKIQKYQIHNIKPRFTNFQSTIRKVRQVHRMRKQRGFAFSQVEGQESIIRKYDTTKKRGTFGELE